MRIKFVYFKANGKFYATGECEWDNTVLVGCIYPREIGRKMNEACKLPGLSSGKWDGPFTVGIDYPELVLPQEPGDD